MHHLDRRYRDAPWSQEQDEAIRRVQAAHHDRQWIDPRNGGRAGQRPRATSQRRDCSPPPSQPWSSRDSRHRSRISPQPGGGAEARNGVQSRRWLVLGDVGRSTAVPRINPFGDRDVPLVTRRIASSCSCDHGASRYAPIEMMRSGATPSLILGRPSADLVRYPARPPAARASAHPSAVARPPPSSLASPPSLSQPRDLIEQAASAPSAARPRHSNRYPAPLSRYRRSKPLAAP